MESAASLQKLNLDMTGLIEEESERLYKKNLRKP